MASPLPAAPRCAFWRTVRTFPSRTAALRFARSARWSPTVIERGLQVAVVARGDAFDLRLGANIARLLRAEG